MDVMRANRRGRHAVGSFSEQRVCILISLRRLDEVEHARASKNPADALRDTRAAELQWREHGFGPGAIRDRRDETFLGGAEERLAGHGIRGIAPDEVEAGWRATQERRREGIVVEAGSSHR